MAIGKNGGGSGETPFTVLANGQSEFVDEAVALACVADGPNLLTACTEGVPLTPDGTAN